MVAANVPAAAAGGGEAADERKKMAFAATAPAQAAFVLPGAAKPDAAKKPSAAPAAAPAADATSSGEHTKFLPGDPMAPTPEATRPHHPARHTPGGSPASAPNKTWLWVGLGCLGMIVIGGIGVVIAMRLGLLH